MTMKISFDGYGCTQNMGETRLYQNAVEGLEGIVVSTDPLDADICVIGTCVVIETTQLRMFKRIKELVEKGKNVVVTGCLPRVMEVELIERFPDVKIFGFTDTDGFRDWIQKSDKEMDSRQQDGEGVRVTNPKTAIIPISQGCLGACTYCITKLARGNLRSYEPDGIMEMANDLISKGYKELFVTAQDTGAYGFDRKDTDLPALIEMVSSIDPPDDNDYRIRIGMMNPDGAARILPRLIETYKNPRVFKFLHIPVQSGDDGILKRMKRRYTVEDFKTIIQTVRKEIPDITISTDIIVGFPAETEEHFQRSYDLIKQIEPDILNITRFSPRPGTEAFDMDDHIHGRVHKERSRTLTTLRKEIGLRKNKEYLGRRAKALVTEHGSGNTLITRLDNYKVVLITKEVGLDVGDWVRVEVTEATDIYVRGEILDPQPDC
jgi:MiaB-like tRNA modifying enzyme